MTYWVGREFWGKGIATASLRILLAETAERPVHARAASDNVGSLRVLEKAREMGVTSYAVLGFDGGKAKTICDVLIHFETNDMQIAEDAQLILGHMIVQHLNVQADMLESNHA